MALGSTQPLTEMSSRSISWGYRQLVHKADNLPPPCAVVTKSGNLKFLEPSGPLWTCKGTALPFIPKYHIWTSLHSQVYFLLLKHSFVLHSANNKLMHIQVSSAHPSRSTYLVATTTAFPFRIHIFVQHTDFTDNNDMLTRVTQF